MKKKRKINSIPCKTNKSATSTLIHNPSNVNISTDVMDRINIFRNSLFLKDNIT